MLNGIRADLNQYGGTNMNTLKQSIILDAHAFRKFDSYVTLNQQKLSWVYEVEKLHDRFKITVLSDTSVSLFDILQKIEGKALT